MHSERVVYNPAPQRVRFNGASVQLEPVAVPAAGQGQRTTITGASGSNQPPVPPQVSVSTASGKPLQPPPRLRSQEGTDSDMVPGARDTSLEDEQPEADEAQEVGLVAATTEKLRVADSQEKTGGALVGMSDDGRAMLFSTG